MYRREQVALVRYLLLSPTPGPADAGASRRAGSDTAYSQRCRNLIYFRSTELIERDVLVQIQPHYTNSTN